jgi:hypothetical protein
LAGDPGVTHITVESGAATEPAGDPISCDVVRASVNPLLRAVVGVLVSITTIPAAANIGVALAMWHPSEAGKSLAILLINLVGLLAGGVLTLLGTRLWVRRIESGRARFRPKPRPRP